MGKIPLLFLPHTTGISTAERAGPPFAIDADNNAMIGEIHGNVYRLLCPYSKEK
jgi:hypothetical protein